VELVEDVGKPGGGNWGGKGIRWSGCGALLKVFYALFLFYCGIYYRSLLK